MPPLSDHRRPEIDGLRAIAVLLVLLFHARLAFEGGFVGVDVFFVISGYLITGIIRRDQQAGTFSLAQFWYRRIRRIVPAASCLTLSILFAATIYLPSNEIKQVASSAVAHQLMIANWYFWLNTGYFDGPADLKPMLHTWSLSVEEQFYLLFPLLFIVSRKWSQSFVAVQLSLLAVVSFLSCVVAPHQYSSLVFYGLPTRAWEMLLGSLLTFVPPPKRDCYRLCGIGAIIGLTLIIASAVYLSAETRFPGIMALPPTVGAVIFLYATSGPANSITTITSFWPIAAIGRASYSIYLWHWPVLVFLRITSGSALSLECRLTAAIVSVVAGYFSWAMIEEPIRCRRFFSDNRVLLRAFGFSWFGLLATSLIIFNFYRIVDDSVAFDDKPIFAVKKNRRFPIHSDGPVKKLPIDVSQIGVQTALDQKPQFLIWGDSHAKAASEASCSFAEERDVYGYVASRLACPPLLGVHSVVGENEVGSDQIAWNQSILEFILQEKIPHVMIAARWEYKLNGELEFAKSPQEGLLQDDKTTVRSTTDAERVFREGLIRTVEALRVNNTKVWFLKQAPVQDRSDVRPVVKEKPIPKGITRDQYERQERRIDAILSELTDLPLSILGPADSWFDAEGYSAVHSSDTRLYYKDTNHVSLHGAKHYFNPLFQIYFDDFSSPTFPEE